jgi:hypothetical protein
MTFLFQHGPYYRQYVQDATVSLSHKSFYFKKLTELHSKLIPDESVGGIRVRSRWMLSTVSRLRMVWDLLCSFGWAFERQW